MIWQGEDLWLWKLQFLSSSSWTILFSDSWNVKMAPLANIASQLYTGRRWYCRDYWKQEERSLKTCPNELGSESSICLVWFLASLKAHEQKPGVRKKVLPSINQQLEGRWRDVVQMDKQVNINWFCCVISLSNFNNQSRLPWGHQCCLKPL